MLRYFHQMPEREMAEVLGVRPGTVKSRLHSALAALRQQDAEASEPARGEPHDAS